MRSDDPTKSAERPIPRSAPDHAEVSVEPTYAVHSVFGRRVCFVAAYSLTALRELRQMPSEL